MLNVLSSTNCRSFDLDHQLIKTPANCRSANVRRAGSNRPAHCFVASAQKLLGSQSSRHSSTKARQRIGADGQTLTLLTLGANVHGKDLVNNESALHYAVAVYYGEAAIVKLLLDAGADTNARGYSESTPLSLAMNQGSKEVQAVALQPTRLPILRWTTSAWFGARAFTEVYCVPDPTRDGAYAEYIAVRESEIGLKPKSLYHIRAAAVPEPQERSWSVLKPGGVLVSLVQLPSQDKAKELGVRAAQLAAQPNGAQLAEIAGIIDAGQLAPVIDRILPLSEVRRAHELSQSGHTVGKIVLRVSNGNGTFERKTATL